MRVEMVEVEEAVMARGVVVEVGVESSALETRGVEVEVVRTRGVGLGTVEMADEEMEASTSVELDRIARAEEVAGEVISVVEEEGVPLDALATMIVVERDS